MIPFFFIVIRIWRCKSTSIPPPAQGQNGGKIVLNVAFGGGVLIFIRFFTSFNRMLKFHQGKVVFYMLSSLLFF